MRTTLIAATLVAFTLAASCPGLAAEGKKDSFAGKTIVWVDSYDAGYPWSDGIERGIRQVLAGTGINLDVVRLKAKEMGAPAEQEAVAREAYDLIRTSTPDVVIASDDNAQKYLVVPYLKDANVPVVFCGVNWDASMYGYPAENITGMIEVEGVDGMLGLFRRDAKGSRIGYISGDTASDRKITATLNSEFFDKKLKIYFVKNFNEFKDAYLKAQDETDMLFLRNNAGIEGWDDGQAKDFLAANTRIPTGSPLDFMAEFVVYTIGKIPEEQGEWAAKAALGILGGKKPGDIPVARNERAVLTVNLRMAKAAGIVLPVSILKTATVIGRE